MRAPVLLLAVLLSAPAGADVPPSRPRDVSGLVQDGKLRLTLADAVRLALATDAARLDPSRTRRR
jgi:hypothetical protein